MILGHVYLCDLCGRPCGDGSTSALPTVQFQCGEVSLCFCSFECNQKYLDLLCPNFRAEVFRKAGKTDPQEAKP